MGKVIVLGEERSVEVHGVVWKWDMSSEVMVKNEWKVDTLAGGRSPGCGREQEL